MIKIMIVDDMPIFLEYLRTAIDWGAYGFELCCEAKNGVEALEKAVFFQPDIVLSDIQMPYMNGLILTEKLQELNPEISVVLITGNSEFEYARRAIKLGVVDYIVKPFEKEELILTLLSLQDNINKTIELKQDKKDEQYLIRERLLRQLIYVKEIDEILPVQLIENGLNLKNNQYFFITAIEIEAVEKSIDVSEKAMNWKSVIGDLYKDYMQSEGTEYFFTDYESRVLFINVLENKENYSLDQEELDHFMGFIRERLSMNVTIGIGGVYSGLGGIRRSYLESVNALSHRFQASGNKAIWYDAISQEEKTYGFYSAEINEIILNHLHQLNADHTIEVIETVFKEADTKRFSQEYKRMNNMGLISLLLSYLVKAGKNISDVFPDQFHPYNVLNHGNDDEQRRFIKMSYSRAFTYLMAHRETRASQIARDAKRCIDENYSNPEFNMNDLSKKLLVNQTYLRKMFKEEMGMTISEYLSKVRMDRASFLVIEGIYKLSAISEMVGYSDPGYFSKCFKNHFGVSPSEYQ